MNRRNFLSVLAASFALDPERLLWKPGAKLISIPKPKPVGETIWWLNANYIHIDGGAYIQEPFMYGGASNWAIPVSYKLSGNFAASSGMIFDIKK